MKPIICEMRKGNFLRRLAFMKNALIISGLISGLALTAAGIYALGSPAEAKGASEQARSQVQAGASAPSSAVVTAPSAAAVDFEVEDRLLLLALLRRGEAYGDPAIRTEISRRFDAAWVAPTLEVFNFVYDPTVRNHLLNELRQETGQDFGTDMNRWFRWMWNQPELKSVGYDQFKADFYKNIDGRFGRYFEGRADSTTIRLDEVRWGGVRQDGIPPLRNPKMLNVKQAKYLDDDDVVFGIEVNGDVRAYPKRILAWHEMFTDTVGGVEVAGVYCTLCGTVVLYDTVLNGQKYDLGTSGFLLRSNKLMYDKDTQSLWNTLKGEPVVGPLVGKGISLDHRSVVTTTWGKWKALHPQTQVLSLDTGHRRNYDEGVAYHDYFSTDELMFNTPYQDSRLANKQEVLALRFKGQPGSIAIDTDYLNKNPVYSGTLGSQKFVVLTDETGANRVYNPGNVKIVKSNGREAIDANGGVWKIAESRLTAADGRQLKRLPYHRAFWFGWQAAFPSTTLVK